MCWALLIYVFMQKGDVLGIANTVHIFMQKNQKEQMMKSWENAKNLTFSGKFPAFSAHFCLFVQKIGKNKAADPEKRLVTD